MSYPFDSDPIGSLTSNNQLLPPLSGQEQEDILSQQVISTGGQESPNSGSLPLTSAGDQFLLGQSVATLEPQPASANNGGADVLIGENREASQFLSKIVEGALDFFSGDSYPAGGPIYVDDAAYEPYEWQGEVHTWNPGLRQPSPFGLNEALKNDPNFQLVGKVNLGSNTREGYSDGRNGINTGYWGWGHANGDDRLPSDYFVVKGYTETYLEGGQTYRFEAKGDDGYQIWLKKLDTDQHEWYWVTSENQWESTVGEQGTDVFNYTLPADKGGRYYVGFFHYEVDREAYFGLNWKEAPAEQSFNSPPAEQIPSPNFEYRPDGPSVEWIPSPNFGYRPNGSSDVTSIIFHHTASSNIESPINTFLNPGSDVSAHYVIGQDGRIVNMVDTNYRAWHAGESVLNGRSHVNDYSIGIEIVNPDGNFNPYTEAQYQSLEWLTQDLLNKYPSITHLTGHEDVAPGRKSDPGDLFDWNPIREAVYRADPNFYRVVGPL